MDLATFDPSVRLAAATTLEALETPCLVLDADRMDRNITRLRNRLDGLGVSLRPHLKTAKSIDVARRVMIAPEGPATISTLKEAEQFANHGLRDMIYAVGIAPAKLARVVELRAKGVDLVVILDTVEQALAVAEASRKSGMRIPAMIEIDCDGHRSGVVPANHAQLLEIGQALAAGAELRGVLTHAGDSYKGGGPEAQQRYAEAERAAVVGAAQLLRGAGLPCPVVSVGSTPTAHHAQDLTGVTEVRAGVFVFFDLVMAGIGVCQVDDIALSVLATVIGHQREKGWIITDAGWMSLSRDRGTSKQAVDHGYGLVCNIQGDIYRDIIVADANQEHGIIAVRPGSDARLPDLRVGDRVRILPNHACATAAQHQAYHLVQGQSHVVDARWPRFGGW
ncbi:DSD1 family PLP-dependent enzyme [Rhizobium lentis]|uniref:D-serine deaminase-like pyridoxal phosphate-dependent protein n=1 Tax=Rhizobium lentis TaxID=1138194 RepID=A0A7W9CYI8_9HYPH|nr:DSD1 family PLP-dependent enzyme [Rhizobium lentis]MBB4577072.1 D-serine deaminase-like pyridoxal phosphate-dependent protein [Rhizobium lentis]MBB5554069.1 D-serine deaminase-like pyridoxal phosphate-dependent protein [Rhizobium lentis]MBB5564583.1 D-serine deaminase-like pyridoxal phosphate-dependent protein [Rhizobium lentis]MBB5571088.1 D-serine deaminase-like pyridoxal phosphate-dependent protein [Rhizobium lentis]